MRLTWSWEEEKEEEGARGEAGKARVGGVCMTRGLQNCDGGITNNVPHVYSRGIGGDTAALKQCLSIPAISSIALRRMANFVMTDARRLASGDDVTPHQPSLELFHRFVRANKAKEGHYVQG